MRTFRFSSSCFSASLALLGACSSAPHTAATDTATPPPVAEHASTPATPRAAPSIPDVAEARAQLEARVPAQIAWGAWNASSNNLRELAPLVVQKLAAVRDASVSDEQIWVLRALGDAAFQLGARVPPAELVQLAKVGQMRTLALLLATREPAANVALYEELLADARNDEDLAVRNLLAAHAPASIAPRLVPTVAMTLTVEVRDVPYYGSSGRSHTTGIGCGSLTAPPGFPPSVLYALHHGAPHAGVVADGPIPVVYERTVRAEREFGVGASFEGIDAGDYALRLLRWMSGDRAEKGALATELELVHEWRDPDTLLRATTEARSTHQAAWSALLQELEQRGALDHATAATPVPLKVTFLDQRENRGVDLPPVPR